MELKKQGSKVKVTWICPYAIDTGMFAGFESRQAWIVDVLNVSLYTVRGPIKKPLFKKLFC